MIKPSPLGIIWNAYQRKLIIFLIRKQSKRKKFKKIIMVIMTC